jgi:hypothetical protein
LDANPVSGLALSRLVTYQEAVDDPPMSRVRRIRGRTTQYESPEWQPLLDFAPEHVDDFMWMFELELRRGHRLHAYKHYWTRRYIYLDHEGRVWGYCGDDLYQEVDPVRHLSSVLMNDGTEPPPYDIVRRNLWSGSIEIEWARSATKHRISRQRSRHVIETTDLFFEQWIPEKSAPLKGDPRLVFLGEDAEAVELEVVAVELNEARLLVIHAMPMRRHLKERYEESKKWRR